MTGYAAPAVRASGVVRVRGTALNAAGSEKENGKGAIIAANLQGILVKYVYARIAARSTLWTAEGRNTVLIVSLKCTEKLIASKEYTTTIQKSTKQSDQSNAENTTPNTKTK